ncbi:MAG: KilA-N domain-containing protein [Chitinophagales bacterium]|nr:KilA-N domain-containing protein [Chitinophagales bacterium]
MANNKDSIIKYQGNSITLFSDERDDYVNLTEMANAWKGNRKSIKSWLKNQQTLAFLKVWEEKHNPKFSGAQMGTVLQKAKDQGSSLSLKYYIDVTNAKGIFTRETGKIGTYAHKDIAIKFAAWLSPEFELFLVEEIQRLKEVERQKYSYDLLNHDQILALIRLKEVFKFVAHQEMVEDAHKEVYASQSSSKNPFRDFHKWRNEILDIDPKTINDRIMQYCIDNNIALTRKMLTQKKSDKVLMLDTYEAVRNAVWDFLQMQGEVNALKLANLVGDIMRTEKGEVIRSNESDLFHEKQDLGEYSDFEKQLGDMMQVKSAREVLAIRKKLRQDKLPKPKRTDFDNKLIQALNFNPKEDKDKSPE